MAVGDYVQAKFVSFSEVEISPYATEAEDIWARSTKAERDRILSRLLAIFPDAVTFENVMLNRQLPAYQSYINPNHPKASKALLKLRLKWIDDKTYQQWNANVQSAFSAGGDFDTAIDNVVTTNKYEDRIKPVLQVVGVRPLGRSIAPKLMMLLQGYDMSAYIDTNLGESFTDTGVDKPLLDSTLPVSVTQAVIPIIVEGVRWHKAYLAVGDNTTASQMLTDAQTKLQSFISKILDTARFSLATLTLSYDSASDRYTLDIRIDQVA